MYLLVIYAKIYRANYLYLISYLIKRLPVNDTMATEILRRKYKKTPIVEVIFEIQFNEPQEDLTIWGRFHDKIKHDYPEKKKGERISVIRKDDDDSNSVEIIKSDAMRFSKKDVSEIIQLTNDLLTINALSKCYQGYESFRTLIITALNAYTEVAELVSFKQFKLRYINIISLPAKDGEIELKDFFNYYPEIKDQIFYDFSLQFELEAHHNRHEAYVVISSLPESRMGEIGFLIDINNTFHINTKINEPYILTLLNEAHENTGRIFEALITEQTRDLFQEVENETCNW